MYQDIQLSYLTVELNPKLQISHVTHTQTQILLRSPLSETMFTNILKKVLERVDKQKLKEPITDVIKQIFQKGNSEKADLLVEDIFGTDNCGIIGLPAKLIASSLGKYAKQKEGSNYWDQLNSLLNAFAINTALLIHECILLTKAAKVEIKLGDIWHPKMIFTLQSMLGPKTELVAVVPPKQEHSTSHKNTE